MAGSPFRRQLRPLLIGCAAALAFGSANAQEESGSSPEADQALMTRFANEAALPQPDTDDKQTLCVFFHKRANANARLGHYVDAVADLRHALVLNERKPPPDDEWCDRWRLQNDLSNALLAEGDHFARIEHLQAVAAEWRKPNPRRYFYSQLYLTDSQVALGQLKDAELSFQRATAALPEVRARRDWAALQHNVMDLHSRYAAWMQELRGNRVEGERLRRAALQHAREYLADRLQRRDATPGSIRIAEDNVSLTMRQLASNLTAQGKLGEAEYLAKDALAQTLMRSSLGTARASRDLAVLAGIDLQQGKLNAAERYDELSLRSLENGVLPYSIELATRRGQLGFLYTMQGRWNNALEIFAKRDLGLRQNPEQFAKYGSRHMDWAYALLRTGQADQAADMLRSLLAYNLKKPFVDPLYVAHLRGYLGAALAGKGADAAALEQFRGALPMLIKRAQEDAGNEDAGFVRVYRLRTILEAYLELLAKLHIAGEVGSDWAAEAFAVADIARNSSVQRAVTASAARAVLPDAQLANLARREQDAATRIHALNKIVARLASAAEGQRLQTVIGDMQRDIERLTAEQTELRKEISERYPDYAELVDPRPAALTDVQRALKEDEALVTFYSGERQTYVWTLDRNRASLRVVPMDRTQLAQTVAELRRGVELSDAGLKPYDLAVAHHLFAQLLAPSEAIWGGAKLLNVIPHGALGQVPFAALLTAPPSEKSISYAAMPWLIRKVAIAQQSSASGFLALRRASVTAGERRPFIGFGDPLFTAQTATGKGALGRFRNLQVKPVRDAVETLVEHAQQTSQPLAHAALPRPGLNEAFSLLPQLPDTADELREIAGAIGADQRKELFLGSRATEGNVKAMDLSHYRLVAFATHGLVPGELSGLDQPALALANPALTGDRDNDGLLMLDEVLGLKLNADWVVLSACNTASADGSAGEAVSGLGRGFFYAGARSLLVSNWAVESRSARLLTTNLFRLQAGRPGMNRAEALRRSMLDLMAGGSGYDHPVFWAPFSLVGEGGRL